MGFSLRSGPGNRSKTGQLSAWTANRYNDSNIFRQHGIPAIKCGPSGGKVPADAHANAIDICSKDRKEISS